MKKAILLVVSHVCVLAAGFALGVYALPILTAPTAPTLAETSLAASQSIYKGEFRRTSKTVTPSIGGKAQ